ncbi:MAG: DUF3309 family protein, partial [Steroidobacteraceae bacterium]
PRTLISSARNVSELQEWAARRGSWFECQTLCPGSARKQMMGTILIVVLIVLLLGGGGGYYGYSRYGGSGIGGALGLVLVILLVLWFFGGLHLSR